MSNSNLDSCSTVLPLWPDLQLYPVTEDKTTHFLFPFYPYVLHSLMTNGPELRRRSDIDPRDRRSTGSFVTILPHYRASGAEVGRAALARSNRSSVAADKTRWNIAWS